MPSFPERIYDINSEPIKELSGGISAANQFIIVETLLGGGNSNVMIHDVFNRFDKTRTRQDKEYTESVRNKADELRDFVRRIAANVKSSGVEVYSRFLGEIFYPQKGIKLNALPAMAAAYTDLCDLADPQELLAFTQDLRNNPVARQCVKEYMDRIEIV